LPRGSSSNHAQSGGVGLIGLTQALRLLAAILTTGAKQVGGLELTTGPLKARTESDRRPV
jgi:hypothetical protein